jgi:carbamoyltransferase
VLILGLNAYHGDASAALLDDGMIVAAVEEERFTRQKHQAGFPAMAVRWCLEAAGVSLSDVDHVAVSRDPFAHLGRKVAWGLRQGIPVSTLRDRARNAKRIVGTREALAEALDVDPRSVAARLHRVEHHRAHLASAMFCSPFAEAACVSLDGMGDFVSTMWAHGRDNAMSVKGFVPFPASLGVYYTAFTQFLGLPKYGDEYKLMGLAAYGQPRYVEELRRVLMLDRGVRFRLDLDWFRHHELGMAMTWASGAPELGTIFSGRLEERFGPPRPAGPQFAERDADLAASVQARLEEVELELLRRVQGATRSKRLVLAGGVALNCVVNGRIREHTPFDEVWVQPAANDAGTSIGAALWVWNQVLGKPRVWEMTHAYLGPCFEDAAYKAALGEAGLEARYVEDEELFGFVARRLAEGAVVGWYQGASEFGPRALGNRSIVCDPRRADMKDVLNARIKHREPFRPFAPSVLAEETGDWFDQDYPSSFMAMAYRVRPERRKQIPAVTHEDGTGRLQMVRREDNPRFYDLIAAFGLLTGVPILLNTSFNENEPIVCRPEEAVDCYLRTAMDVLVLGNWLVER